jgi:nitroimidazol reductase NimA-like FMN-containing flavoprotein (pyridoxamine 5'-phosphate oxidase superfamily)
LTVLWLTPAVCAPRRGIRYKPANANRLYRSTIIEGRAQVIVREPVKSETRTREIAVERAAPTEEWIIRRLKHVIDLGIRGLG